MAATESQKKYIKERYHNDPEFREKSLEASSAWAYANPARKNAHTKRHYYKKQALLASKVNNTEKMIDYMRKYFTLGEQLGL